MFHVDGIEVYIQSADGKQRYVEHELPGRSFDSSKRVNAVAIEAIPDEQYEIVVKVKPEFKVYSATQVKIQRKIDSWSARWSSLNLRRGTELSYTMTDQYYMANGQWMKGNLTFGALRLDKLSCFKSFNKHTERSSR